MKKHTILYIISLLVFGFNGIAASRVSLSSYQIVFYRTLIGCGMLILLFLASGGKLALRQTNKKHLLYVMGSGAAMGISWLLLFEAYNRAGVGLASLLYYTGPVFVVLLSPLIFREKLTMHKMFCFLIVLLGMVQTNLSQIQGGGNKTGLLFGILAAFMYAFMVILSKKADSITGLKNSAIQIAASFLTVAVYVLFKHGVQLPRTHAEWFWLVLLGVLNTGFACYLYFSSIGHLPVQTFSVLGYIEPLSALVFSAVLLHESFHAQQIFGAALILGGAFLLNVKFSALIPHRAKSVPGHIW